jgi:hypothetical protein
MPLVSRTFDQLIDFTRTSSATFVGSNGLIQNTPASVNLLTYTQEFDNAAWAKIALTATANTTTAPDGTSTADTITATAGTSGRNTNTGGGGSGAALTLSVYAKQGTLGFVQLSHAASGTIFANFNLATGAVGTVGAGATAAIVSAGDGWYRCSITFTPGSAGASRIGPVTSATAIYAESWTAAGTETIFLWGAQLQTGSTATTYTRNFGGLFPPRFDYTPISLAPRGLLVEEQRVNLLLYSEQFDNAYWTPSGTTVTANTSVAPDGTTTADTIDDGLTTGLHRVFRASLTMTAAAQTFSCFVKAGTGAWFQLTAFDGVTSFYANFNVSTGVVGNKTAAATSSITPFGNGWYRCVMTATTAATAAGNFQVVAMDADTAIQTPSFTGANRTWFVWGAQHEAGGGATSYIPTVASQVTRVGDIANISAPNFAPWYNQSEGTLMAEYSSFATTVAASKAVTASYDGTGNNRLMVYLFTDAPAFTATVGGATQALLSTTAVTANSVVKSAVAFRANDFAFSTNGSVALTDTSGSLPVTNSLALGSLAGSIPLNGHLRRIVFYPTRLTNVQIQALTT